MPKICYKDKPFSADHVRVVEQANAICDEYQRDGFTLTLRQLYYQFVARGLIENTMQSYKRLGSIINDARLAGLIDWDAIEDRTRNLESLNTWESPKDIIDACARQFRYDWWKDQPNRFEIWVEKEALAGVIERTANRYRVPYFACRGYTSQSEAWRAGQRFLDYAQAGQAIKILHLGDHDPSGIDMTRDNSDRLDLFTTDPEGSFDLPDGVDINVKRLALNYSQVEEHKPPPNPAKLTDSRADGYVKRFGNESWELDALDPHVIDRLISEEIDRYIDRPAWEKSQAREKAARAKIGDVADNWKDDEEPNDESGEAGDDV